MNAKTFEARIEKLKKQAARDHAQRVADENEQRFDRMYDRGMPPSMEDEAADYAEAQQERRNAKMLLLALSH